MGAVDLDGGRCTQIGGVDWSEEEAYRKAEKGKDSSALFYDAGQIIMVGLQGCMI
jgi:hypothetical protein